jgi:hypothetical protein
MAGILFTNRTMVLGGYKMEKQYITGIGGKMYKGETPCVTAVRETIEELFEFERIPSQLLQNLYNVLIFDNVMAYRGYSTFIMDFQELDKIFTEVGKFELKSKCYQNIPKNLIELIMTRIPSNTIELSHLALIPAEAYAIDRHFVSDIQTFKTCELSM